MALAAQGEGGGGSRQDNKLPVHSGGALACDLVRAQAPRCSEGGEGVPASQPGLRIPGIFSVPSLLCLPTELAHFAPRARPSPTPHSHDTLEKSPPASPPFLWFQGPLGHGCPPSSTHAGVTQEALESAPELQPAPCRHCTEHPSQEGDKELEAEGPWMLGPLVLGGGGPIPCPGSGWE